MDKNDNTTSEKAKAESMLKELTNLKENFIGLSTYVKEAMERIHSDAKDVKYNMETENTLRIGKECVQPLIEVKTLAAEIFSNVRNNEVNLLHQEIDMKPFLRYNNEMKKMNSETQEIIHMLTSLKDSIPKLIEQEKNQKVDTDANDPSASSSMATDLSSSSECSFFGNSSTVPTSSPIPEN